MQIWEYKTIELKKGKWIEDPELNELGSSGWELVTVLYNERYTGGLHPDKFLFKRPKQ